MQAAAFLVFFPIGNAVAVFRSYLGPWWLKVHLISQFVATFLVLGSVTLIASKGEHFTSENKEKEKYNKAHHILGPIVVSLIVLQWIWALLVRGHVAWDTWFKVHMALAILVMTSGWSQIYIGWQMYKK